MRHLFGTQLSAGRVERVEFENVPTKKNAGQILTQGNVTKSKKRKRVTADELQNQLDDIELPSTYDRQLQKSGAHAVVVFADKPSMETSMKAAVKAAKRDVKIIWGDGIEDRIPSLGLSRYVGHDLYRYPDRRELLSTVNDYMTVFTHVAEARKREQSRAVQEPDEDGFVTVTHGPKLNSVAREEEYKEMVEKQKKKQEGLEDFYRFQSREKRKEKQHDLLKRFDEDRKKLNELKRSKGKIRVSFIRPELHGLANMVPA